jgi:hypothetical protein
MREEVFDRRLPLIFVSRQGILFTAGVPQAVQRINRFLSSGLLDIVSNHTGES